jgi:hypothetical protein
MPCQSSASAFSVRDLCPRSVYTDHAHRSQLVIPTVPIHTRLPPTETISPRSQRRRGDCKRSAFNGFLTPLHGCSIVPWLEFTPQTNPRQQISGFNRRHASVGPIPLGYIVDSLGPSTRIHCTFRHLFVVTLLTTERFSCNQKKIEKGSRRSARIRGLVVMV